jgi:glycosyltransferase involved in cell wall biosynthesis
VMSSLFEGLPTVLVEAMTCGTPIVSTDCPSGPREILQDGRLGILVPMQDPASLARGIEKTLDRRAPVVPADSWRPYSLDSIVRQYLSVLLENDTHDTTADSCVPGQDK